MTYQFTPNPNLLSDSLNAGLRTGGAIAELAHGKRRRSVLQQLADRAAGGFNTQEDYNQFGSELIRMGEVEAGLNTIATPYSRMQDQQQAQALADHRNTRNELDRQTLQLRGEELRAKLDPQSPFNRKPLSSVGKIQGDYESGLISENQRNAAIAKANSTRNGITIKHPDGTQTVIGGASGGGLGKAATNHLQKSAIGNHELLSLTNAVRESFRPEFLTFKAQGEQFFGRNAEKLGLSVDDSRKQFLKDRTTFVTQTERLFNAYRKEITGAAAAVQELDRLKKSFLNADQSPSEFEATLDSYQEELKRTLRLRNRLLREGLDPRSQQGGTRFDNLFLTGGDDDIEQRGLELQRQGMSQEEILATLDSEGY